MSEENRTQPGEESKDPTELSEKDLEGVAGGTGTAPPTTFLKIESPLLK
jgi:hypothetical protein